MPPAHRRRSGAAILAFCIAVAALLAMAATSILLQASVRGLQSTYYRHKAQALYAAEAGIETALVILNRPGGRLPRRLSGTCGDATWELMVPADPAIIVCSGICRPRPGGIIRCDLYVRLATVGGRCRVARWQWPQFPRPTWLTPELFQSVRRMEGLP